jgi:hypothetical protein
MQDLASVVMGADAAEESGLVARGEDVGNQMPGLVFKAVMRHGWPMIWRGLMLAGVCGVALPLVAEVSSLTEGRYQLIVHRNPFSLVPPKVEPPPAAKPVTNPPVEVPKLQLSGISVGPGGRYAWLVAPVAPPKRTNAVYWKVREGEGHEGVDVIEIDPRTRSVRVNNNGTMMVLDLTKDSPAPVGPVVVPGQPAAAGAGRPGARPGVATPVVPGARPVLPSQPGAVPGLTPRQAGTGNLRTVGSNPTGLATASPTLQGVPARQLRTPTAEAAGPVDPAVQWIQMRAAEEVARQRGQLQPPTPPLPGAYE